MNHAPLTHSKRAMILMTLAAGCPFASAATAGYLSTSTAAGTSQVGPAAVYAGSEQQDSINARETARRQAKSAEAMQLLQEGRTAYAEKKYKDALDKYQAAWNAIPKAPATQKMQEFIVKSIGDASIAVAIEYSRIGRYDDAEQLLLDVLSRDPNNARARKELSLLRDPIRNNPALTPEHVKNVEEVNRLLTLAYGYLDLGNYDAAYAEFNRVIAIDPYNTAARRGQEAVSKRRSAYYTAAHDSYRAKALAEVDAIWEEQLPQDLPEIELGSAETAQVSEGVLRNSENLNALRISAVNFEETPMEDALDFLRAEARKSGMQINFIYEKAQAAAPAPAPAPVATSSDDDDEDSDDEEEDSAPVAAPVAVQQTIAPAIIPSLKLTDISAADLLRSMCSLAGCEMRVEDNAVVVYQKGAASQRMTRRQWTVRPSFFNSSEESDDEDDEDSDFSSGPKHKARKIDAKASLIDMGVSFPQGASAQYSRITGVLTVYNTDDELDTVEEAINKFRQDMPKMVKVSAKFVEISQQNDEELSFDWVINPFSINDAGTAFLGGVNGSNASTNRYVSDFVSSGGKGFSNNNHNSGSWPIHKTLNSKDPISDGLMTGSLRSGSGAINTSAINNLIHSGSASASATSNTAPGILSLSGIYDSGSFQMIMRGLSQKKGVDVMSAPSLVISGDEPMEYAPAPDPLASDQNDEQGCAKIEVVRRFVYPIAYDEPQISSSGGGYNNNNNNNNNGYSGSMPVAAPANPSEWAVEEVGIMMRFQIEPLKDSDGDIVRFKRFEIRVVDFEGFVNYGSPITAAVANDRQIEHVELTENRIDMPIFSRRYINSNPCVYDGHTIAIGGLIEDEVQKVEDKVPVFGDLPLVGRLFRSEAESHVRKNLMIFVTADVIDPFGKPLRQRQTGSASGAASAATGAGLFPDDGLVNP